MIFCSKLKFLFYFILGKLIINKPSAFTVELVKKVVSSLMRTCLAYLFFGDSCSSAMKVSLENNAQGGDKHCEAMHFK